MADGMYDGTFKNGVSYTLTQIKGKFRCKDPRPVVRWLERLEIPWVESPKGEIVVLGDDINLAIAEHARCGESQDPPAAGESQSTSRGAKTATRSSSGR